MLRKNTMLEYVRESKQFITAKYEGRSIATLYFNEKYGIWRIYSINSSNAEPADLRQIADKLDELNKTD